MARLGRVMCSVVVALAVGVGFTQAARAEVRLPKVFSSHMVMQQEKPLVAWGWAEPNEKVTVELAGASQQVQANERGEWKAVLPGHEGGRALYPHGERFQHGPVRGCDDR